MNQEWATYNFDYPLAYASQIWGQSKPDQLKKLIQLQEKACKIINFFPDVAPLQEIYHNFKVLKLLDYIFVTKHTACK